MKQHDADLSWAKSDAESMFVENPERDDLEHDITFWKETYTKLD